MSWNSVIKPACDDCGWSPGGRKEDIHVTKELSQIWEGSELLKTVLKADKKKRGSGEGSIQSAAEEALELEEMGIKRQSVEIVKDQLP